MEKSKGRYLAVFLACCFIAVSCVSAQPSTPSYEDELWSVMDASQKDLGLFWTAINMSGYVQDKSFATLAQGNYTILAPTNSSLIKYVQQLKLNLSQLASPNVTKMLFPLIEYHVVKGLQKFGDLPLNEPKSFDTLLTGVPNDLCPAGPLNVTKVSKDRALVSAGGNYANADLTDTGAVSNNQYAVYGIDEILSPCCLMINFSSLGLPTLLSSPQLQGYISGVDTTILGKIQGFLLYALSYIKDNGEKLNSMPFTVILPYPSAIAAALETVPNPTQAVYEAVFLNHIVPEVVSVDTIIAAGGSQGVRTVLDRTYALSCNNTLTASYDPASGGVPTFEVSGSTTKTTTNLGIKLCNGGMLYFADSVILPCNLTDAVNSVANNLTTEGKAGQTPSDAPPGSGSPSSGSSPAASPPPASKTTTASPAGAVIPMQWVMNLVVAFSLWLAVC